jgi:hypothetical protein
MTQMSKNHVDEDECDRRIEYSIPPGALCSEDAEAVAGMDACAQARGEQVVVY